MQLLLKLVLDIEHGSSGWRPKPAVASSGKTAAIAEGWAVDGRTRAAPFYRRLGVQVQEDRSIWKIVNQLVHEGAGVDSSKKLSCGPRSEKCLKKQKILFCQCSNENCAILSNMRKYVLLGRSTKKGVAFVKFLLTG